jgi:serine/threonine protein kinase/WD40 repeat protein/tetratricopeptide (TPR) repeat protein
MNDLSSNRNPIEQLAADFAERYRRGERPALSEYTARYPHLADEIRELFPALVALERLKPGSGEGTGDYMTDRSVSPPFERLGDFRILREVGRGGMGIVYEAEQVSLGRHVALKVLPAHSLLEPRRLERFQREARAAARLHHTNIVPVYGVGEQDGLHYFVMQYIPGLGLDQVLRELQRLRAAPGTTPATVPAADAARSLLTGRFRAPSAEEGGDAVVAPADPPPPSADSAIVLPESPEGGSLSGPGRPYWRSVARIGEQVACALAYAHAQGTLHRDVKPANLLLDAQGNVWVADFGLAKAEGSDDLTHSGEVVGTLRYMAPERFGRKGDARSDLYALGLVLYELLALRPAFTEQDPARLIQQVVGMEPPRLGSLASGVPRDLETVIHKAIDKDPARRYRSGEEMADDLRRFLDDRPVRARRVGTAERFRRWCRRNPLVASLTATIAVLLIAAAVASLLAAARARDVASSEASAARTAEQARQRTERLIGQQYVRNGTDLLEKGDLSGALLWYAEALKQDHGDPGRTAQHRLRLGTLLAECPRPQHAWFHSEPVVRAAFSGDGRRVLTAAGKTVRVWNTASGQAVGKPLVHAHFVHEAVLSADGSRAVILTRNVPAGGILVGPPWGVTVWDGQTAACLQIWDVDSGAALTPPLPHLERLQLVAAPGGERVLIVPGYSTLQVREVANGRPIGSPRLESGVHLEQALLLPGGTKVLCSARRPRKAPADKQGRGGKGPVIAFPPYVCNVHVVSITGVPPLSLPVPTEAMQGTVFLSPDGSLARGEFDKGGVWVWDLARGKVTASLRPDGHRWGADPQSGFSPDGRLLLARGEVRSAGRSRWEQRLFDPATGEAVGHFFAAPHLARFSPNSRWVLMNDRDRAGAPLVVDARTGQALGPSLQHERAVTQTEFSPDGRLVLTVSGDNAVRIWDPVQGKLAYPALRHGEGLAWAAFSPDGSQVLTIGGTAARLWPLAVLPCSDRLVRLNDFVFHTLLSPDGRRLLTVSVHVPRKGFMNFGEWETLMAFWDAETGKPVGRPTGFLGNLSDCRLSHDGKRVHVLLQGKWLNKSWSWWEPATGRIQVMAPPAGAEFEEIGFSEDGRWVHTLAGSPPPDKLGQERAKVKVARVYDAATCVPVGKPLRQDGGLRVVELSPDRSLVLLARGKSFNQLEGRVHDLRTGKVLTQPLWLGEGEARTSRFRFSQDGRRVLGWVVDWGSSGQFRIRARVWDARDGDPLSPLLRLEVAGFPERPGTTVDLTWSPNGTRLLTTHLGEGGTGAVRIWDVATGQALTPLLPHEGVVTVARFAPDDSSVATGSTDGTVQLWDPASGKALTPPLRHQGQPHFLRFSPDGRLLLVATSQPQQPLVLGCVQVWDVATGQPLCPPLRTRSPELRGSLARHDRATLSADGRRIALIHDDYTVELRDLNADDRPVADLVALAETLAGRRVSPTAGLQPLPAGAIKAGWARLGLPPGAPLCGRPWHRRNLPPMVLAMGGVPEETWAFSTAWHFDRLPEEKSTSPLEDALRLSVYHQLQRWTDTLPTMTRLLDNGVETLRRARAEVYLEVGRWEEAAADLERTAATTKDWDDRSRALALLAYTRLAQGDRARYQAACARLQAELPRETHRLWPPALRHLWPCLLSSADDSGMGKVLDLLIERSEDSRDFPLRSAALFRSGRYEEAEKALTKLTAGREPARPAVWFFLAMVQANQGTDGRKAARDTLRRGMERLREVLREQPQGPWFINRGSPPCHLVEQFLQRQATDEVKALKK